VSDKSEAAAPAPPELEPTSLGPERKANYVEILSLLWKAKRTIALVVGVTTALAVVISLLLPETFKSTTTILPETEKGKLSGMMGGLSEIALMAGVSTGEAPLTRLYPFIINSEAVLKRVIYARYQTPESKDSTDLVQVWEIQEKTRALEYEAALKRLRRDLDVSLDNRTLLLTLSIETRYPQLSADILNNIDRQLDEFIRTKRATSASEQRKWIEGRLEEVKQDLGRAENRLKSFREANRRISDSPQLQMEHARIVRDVEIDNTLYIELKKQYEIVKIEEIKNIPVINILDPARPAGKKENPKRSIIVLVAFLLSACVSSIFVILVRRYGTEINVATRVLGFSSKHRPVPEGAGERKI
jgi:uncharacterized protein involved in exopolysaccharide biosynthesis